MTKTHSALSTLYYLLLDYLLRIRRQNNSKNHGPSSKTKVAVAASSGSAVPSGQFANMNIAIPQSSGNSSNNAPPISSGRNQKEPGYMQNTHSAQSRNVFVINGNDGPSSRPRSASAGRPSGTHLIENDS